jgi:spore coat polysaccharide biosynthesis protein SpsF
MTNILGIVVSRMDSGRLPGKALLLLGGNPVVRHTLERARRITGIDHLVLATSNRPIDDPLAEYCEQEGFAVFRGQAEDVAKRLLDCAKDNGADYFCRLNGDSPLLDPELYDSAIQYLDDGHFDLISNLPGRTFPYGISVEIVSTASMLRAYPLMTASHREHVTTYFYEHSTDFAIRVFTSGLREIASARMVVDTLDDLQRLQEVSERLHSGLLATSYQEVAAKMLARSPLTRER